MANTNYYEHLDDFGSLIYNNGTYDNPERIECVIKDGIMPRDVKRIFKHCNHEYNKRYYFLSESEQEIYQFFPNKDGGFISSVYGRIPKGGKSIIFYIIPDSDDGIHKETHYRDNIIMSKNLLNRIKGMNKIILESTRTKQNH